MRAVISAAQLFRRWCVTSYPQAERCTATAAYLTFCSQFSVANAVSLGRNIYRFGGKTDHRRLLAVVYRRQPGDYHRRPWTADELYLAPWVQRQRYLANQTPPRRKMWWIVGVDDGVAAVCVRTGNEAGKEAR